MSYYMDEHGRPTMVSEPGDVGTGAVDASGSVSSTLHTDSSGTIVLVLILVVSCVVFCLYLYFYISPIIRNKSCISPFGPTLFQDLEKGNSNTGERGDMVMVKEKLGDSGQSVQNNQESGGSTGINGETSSSNSEKKRIIRDTRRYAMHFPTTFKLNVNDSESDSTTTLLPSPPDPIYHIPRSLKISDSDSVYTLGNLNHNRLSSGHVSFSGGLNLINANIISYGETSASTSRFSITQSQEVEPEVPLPSSKESQHVHFKFQQTPIKSSTSKSNRKPLPNNPSQRSRRDRDRCNSLQDQKHIELYDLPKRPRTIYERTTPIH